MEHKCREEGGKDSKVQNGPKEQTEREKNPRSGGMRFLVDKLALRQVYVRVLQCFRSVSSHRCSIFIHSSDTHVYNSILAIVVNTTLILDTDGGQLHAPAALARYAWARTWAEPCVR
jgi:hypothetical protein